MKPVKINGRKVEITKIYYANCVEDSYVEEAYAIHWANGFLLFLLRMFTKAAKAVDDLLESQKLNDEELAELTDESAMEISEGWYEEQMCKAEDRADMLADR